MSHSLLNPQGLQHCLAHGSKQYIFGTELVETSGSQSGVPGAAATTSLGMMC